jgi:hypothetical protein
MSRNLRGGRVKKGSYMMTGLLAVDFGVSAVTPSMAILGTLSSNSLLPLSYVGEIGIHTGIWAMTVPSLMKFSFPLCAVGLSGLASPIFTYYALRFVSTPVSLKQSILSSC